MTDLRTFRHGIPGLLLLALALPPVAGSAAPPESRATTARTQLRIFQNALELYRMDHGGAPPPAKPGLIALIRKPTVASDAKRWKGPYLTQPAVPRDPWGRAYVYRVPGPRGTDYEVLTYGADGKPGGQGENEDFSTARR